MEQGYWDTAQICQNGDVTNATIRHCPEASDNFCEDCGEPTSTTCLAGHPIRSLWIDANNVPDGDPQDWKAPNFCKECGEAYEWTKRRIAKLVHIAKQRGGLDMESSDELERLAR